MKKLFLTAAAVAAVAVCATRAQSTIQAMACTDLVLNGTAATGSGTISYQWYSGPTVAACTTAIAGCATQSCTIPATNAINTVVYKRTVVSSECPTETKETTTLTVQYQGLRLGAVCWAPVNVGTTGAWAQNVDDYGAFFQFNRSAPWSATDPATGVPILGWPVPYENTPLWDEAANPVCPTGWRMPNNEEFQSLHNASTAGSASEAGTWVAGGAKGNAVVGKFYGSKHATCSLAAGGSTDSCIFLPASGHRISTLGSLNAQGTYGYYWSAEQNGSTNGYNLFFSGTSSTPANFLNKSNGYNVRCVKTM
jgi:uncharacterized protein (TIGR02145 family)